LTSRPGPLFDIDVEDQRTGVNSLELIRELRSVTSPPSKEPTETEPFWGAVTVSQQHIHVTPKITYLHDMEIELQRADEKHLIKI